MREGPEEPLEVFDLDSDPAEAVDVSRQHSDVAEAILDYMDSALTELPKSD